MKKDDNKTIMKYMSLGMEFSSSILGFTFVGILLDKKILTTPLFTIIGMFLGFAVGMYMLVNISKKINKNDDDDGDLIR